ncbi:hypothetical protein D3C85_1130110 [compost metagenome]
MLGQLECIFKQIKCVIDAKITYVHDTKAMHRNSQYNRLQPSTLTGVTLALAHKTFDIFTHELTVSFLMAALEIWNHPFVNRFVGAATSKIHSILLTTSTIKHLVKLLLT